MPSLSPTTRRAILTAQQEEITEHKVYTRLAKITKNEKNKKILTQIAADELSHYQYWKTYTNKECTPNGKKVRFYFWMARLFGLTFTIKLMEKGEKGAQNKYKQILKEIPETKRIIEDEEKHEQALIGMLDEKFLQYVGSIVLGLNDALVELTGALAGLSFALQNTKLVALTGLVTGIAAAFSMAGSEYLATKTDSDTKTALTSSLYTGVAYIITVALLILPFLTIADYRIALGATLCIAILIIFVFNFYISTAKDYNFKQRFFEMAGISLGVAALSFCVGLVIRNVFGIEV